MLASVGLAESGSIFTSIVSFDGNLITARRDQNLNSPELKRANETIAMFDSQIRAAQDNRNKMPELWISRKEKADIEIASLIERRQAAVAVADSIDVSTSGKAMDNVQNAIGVTQSQIALIFAILLSCIPFSINLGLGSLQRSAAGAQAVKKPQRPNLKAVA